MGVFGGLGWAADIARRVWAGQRVLRAGFGPLGFEREFSGGFLAKRPRNCGAVVYKCIKGDYPLVHFPCEQHWAHLAPVQFCLVQWVQSCFLALPPPLANATGPASNAAVMANKNAFLIYLIELNDVKMCCFLKRDYAAFGGFQQAG